MAVETREEAYREEASRVLLGEVPIDMGSHYIKKRRKFSDHLSEKPPSPVIGIDAGQQINIWVNKDVMRIQSHSTLSWTVLCGIDGTIHSTPSFQHTLLFQHNHR